MPIYYFLLNEIEKINLFNIKTTKLSDYIANDIFARF